MASSELIKKQMLGGKMREWVVEYIKDPLLMAIVALGNKYPEPTKENTQIPNTHVLIDIRDRFKELEENGSRIKLFLTAFKVLIDEYEHDPYYRYRFDWFLEEIQKRGWQKRPQGRPSACWKEYGVPIYEMECQQCHSNFEVKAGTREEIRCPGCKSTRVKKLITNVTHFWKDGSAPT